MVGRTNSTLNGSGFVPDGGTVTPIDDVSVWLKCAGIKDKKYTTAGEVLTDSTTMFLLTSDENAMKYLARSTGFADDLCADETFMTYLGQSPYVDGTVLNSDLWVNAICNSEFFELVITKLIPTMTSNTEPSGIASASSEYTNEPAWKAFDSNETTSWSCGDNTGAGEYVQFDFEKTVTVKKIYFMLRGQASHWGRSTTYIIQGSNDSNSWNDLYTGTKYSHSTDSNSFKETIILTNIAKYKCFRVYFTAPSDGPVGVVELQLYGLL